MDLIVGFEDRSKSCSTGRRFLQGKQFTDEFGIIIGGKIVSHSMSNRDRFDRL